MSRCICCRNVLEYSPVDDERMCENLSCERCGIFVTACDIRVDELLYKKDAEIAGLKDMLQAILNLDDTCDVDYAEQLFDTAYELLNKEG